MADIGALLKALKLSVVDFVPAALDDELESLQSVYPQPGEQVHLVGKPGEIRVSVGRGSWVVMRRVVPAVFLQSPRDVKTAIAFAVAACRLELQKILPCEGS